MDNEITKEEIQRKILQDWKDKNLSLQQDKTNSFFSGEFFGENIVPSFCNEINESLKKTPQERYLIGLVQATLSGKTRLLLETSLHRPLIIVAFKSQDDAYQELLRQLLLLNPGGSAISENFQERLLVDQRMHLLVRLFFVAYLDFVDLLLSGKEWEELDIPERKALFALLMEGGGSHVNNLFLLRVKEFAVDTSEDVEGLKKRIEDVYFQLSTRLGSLCWALDECHVPTTAFEGFFFHSDYEDQVRVHGEEKVLEWQQYELSRNRHTPGDYPYQSKTNLFSAFRLLAEEFLEEGQMTIFASTSFSCWESLLDRGTHSRDKSDIIPFLKFHLLTVDDIFRILNRMHPHPQLFRDEEIRKSLQEWVGRPGFFFQYLWSAISSESTPERIKIGMSEGVEKAMRGIRGYFYFLHSSSKPSGDVQETVDYLVYRVLLHGGQVTDEKRLKQLVSAGLLLRRGINHADLVDPLVRKELFKESELAIVRAQTRLLKEEGSRADKLAELGVGLRVVALQGRPLSELVAEWMPVNPVSPAIDSFLETFTLCSSYCGSVEELGIDHPFVPESPLWKDCLVFPRTGLHLPDIPFVAKREDNDNEICFVSLQVKQKTDKLEGPNKTASSKERPTKKVKRDSNKKAFFHVLASTNRSEFGRGARNFGKIQNCWKKLVKEKKVFHLRMILCWAGFTPHQVALVAKHNEDYPEQPIFLIDPGSGNGNNIYGERIYKSLKKLTHKPKTQQTKPPRLSEQHLEALRLVLHPHEVWEIHDVESDDSDDNEEGSNDEEEDSDNE